METPHLLTWTSWIFFLLRKKTDTPAPPLLTYAEVLVLQQSGDLRLQGDGITQQDILPRHLTLVAVVEPQSESPLAGVFDDAARVEVAVGRPLGHHPQADEAAPGRARLLRRRPERVGVAGQLGVCGAGGEARGEHAGEGFVLRGVMWRTAAEPLQWAATTSTSP